MSKGPWKKKRVTPQQTQPTDVKPSATAFVFGGGDPGVPGKNPSEVVTPEGSPGAIPPPLPPIGGATPNLGPLPPAGGTAPVLPSPTDTKALKAGVGKTFVATSNALPHWSNLALDKFFPRAAVRVEIDPVSPEEGDLWAEFAWPVIEKYMPKFKESPEYALVVVTLGIWAGRLRIKKTNGGTNAGNQPRSEIIP